MFACGLLLSVLTLGGCEDEPAPVARERLLERPVATTYQINANPEHVIGCYRKPDTASERLTQLEKGQLVDLVSVEEGMYQRGNDFWLHVYPRLSHRPACFINVRWLVPYS